MLKRRASFIIYIFLTLFPAVYLMATGGRDFGISLNQRRMGLLVNSLLIAALTAAVCVIISVFAALRLDMAFKKMPVVSWLFLLMAAMPSYIYALSYMNLIRFIGKFYPAVLRTRLIGMFPCVIVESLAFLPFALAAAMIGLEQAESAEWKAALLFVDADKAFFRVALPKILPFSLGMGAVIFVLSITDYAIPSLFQVNVYAMEIFSDYSAAGQSTHSFRLALPLILISSAAILFSVIGFGNISRPMKDNTDLKPQYSKKLIAVGNICVGFALLQIILPLVSMFPYLTEFSSEYVPVWEELLNSCICGLLAVFILLIPSASMALTLSEEKKAEKTILMALSLIPLTIPGVLTGIGVLRVFSDSFLYPFRRSMLFPAVGMAVRYMPFAMIIQYGAYLRMDREKIRAAILLQTQSIKGFFGVKLPMMLPGIFVSSVVVFLLTLGDVGTALMLMVAGKEPLSVKIYNYLHYGSSETVAVFCLIQMIVCLALMIILYLVIVGRKGVVKKCWKLKT